MNKTRSKGWIWIAGYTALFIAFFVACYGGMPATGRLSIWEVDGLMQHYPYMMYIGQWLRENLAAVFTGGAVQSFDFALGLGEDVLTSLNYYGLGDPLLLISALFTGPATEWCYLLIIALKGWLAGLGCIALGRKLNLKWNQAVCAGILYAFSLGFFTEAATHHSIFANPYWHFPLILLGMECVFERRRSWILTLSVALSALCGFYFLYCNSALLLIYAVVRQLTRRTERRWRTFPGVAGRAIGWYLLGIGLSACVFLPVLWGFFHGQRTAGGATEFRLTYSSYNYLSFPLAALTGRTVGAVPFVPAVALIGIAAMLLHPLKNIRWLCMLAVLAMMLAVPATGLALNGFSYEATRWNYAAYLAVALAGGGMLPGLMRLKKREAVGVAAVGCILLAYCAFAWVKEIGGRTYSALAAALVFVALLTILLANALRAKGHMRWAAVAMGLMVLANSALVHQMKWSERADEMLPRGESYAAAVTSPYADLPETQTFARTDSTVESTLEQTNSSAIEGVAGTSVYNSILNGNAWQFMTDVESAGRVNINAIDGLDCRAALEALWSVGRYVCSEEASARIPYGFAYSGETQNGHLIYENANALPIGWAMTEAITMEDYGALSPLEKQWALLQCMALEQIPEGVAEAQPVQSVSEIEISDVQMEHVEESGKLLKVTPESVIRITFDAPGDCELYLRLDGFGMRAGAADMDTHILFSSGACKSYICPLPDAAVSSVRRDYFLINLGYDENARTTAEIRFSRSGTYRLEELKLYAQPMEDYEALVGAMRENGLENIVLGDDSVSGTIAISAPGAVVFSIPYSEGWTAVVDGQTVETLASAHAFLTVPVGEGTHEILLTYRTPWLTAGMVVSAASLVAMLAAIVIGAGRRRVKGA